MWGGSAGRAEPFGALTSPKEAVVASRRLRRADAEPVAEARAVDDR
jgi:hypothetical protein